MPGFQLPISFMKFILGKKLEMSQIFDEEGRAVPITLIEAGPCFVTQIKTKEKDGYEAIQIGFEKLKPKKVKKPQKKKPYRYLRELKLRPSRPSVLPTRPKEEKKELKVGDKIDASIFKEGEKVSVSGISKGKGFAGAVKRWGFKGMPKTHGTKQKERGLGSVGMRWPQRVLKGKKMPGRMGGERITVKNLKIIKVDEENNLIAVKGAIPGRKGTLLEIRSRS